MQTFLPYRSFNLSARSLDRQRLGKQRVETMQIMRALTEGVGWVNHPATLMWKGYEHALYDYQFAVVMEWRKRGYEDTCLDKTYALLPEHCQLAAAIGEAPVESMPPWLGNRRFHRSHQSNLIRKMPEHYRVQFPNTPDNLEYVWPTKEGMM